MAQTQKFILAAIISFIAVTNALRLPIKVKEIKTNSGDNSWDYLLMVTRWAGTEGYGKTLPANVTGFPLHGIWPTRNDGSWPQYCNNDPFVQSTLSPLVPELKVAWYDFEGNGFSFWQHEWERHGTCAESISQMNSLYNFFSSAIGVWKQYDIRAALDDAGIDPSSSTYSASSIAQALTSAFGQQPILTCKGIHGLGTAIYLVEFCLDKSLTIQACPSQLYAKRGDSCSGNVYFPPTNNYDN